MPIAAAIANSHSRFSVAGVIASILMLLVVFRFRFRYKLYKTQGRRGQGRAKSDVCMTRLQHRTATFLVADEAMTDLA
jgi:hypothetical protein